MQNIIVRNKKYLLFVLVIVLIGLTFGILYYYFLNQETQSNIINTISNYNSYQYNFIFKDLIIMSLLLVTSFFIIGLPLSLFYLCYESFAIGFLLNIFFISFGIQGLVYILLFIIFNKLLSLILKIIFLKKTISISRYLIGLIIYKKNESLKKRIIINFKMAVYMIVFSLILNIILYLVSPMIFKSLAFSLKLFTI